MATRYRRFRDISMSERILDTLFLVTIGIGYLFAIVHVYYTHSGRDGKPGLSVEDVRIAYYGDAEHTRLSAAIQGPMKPNLHSQGEQIAILKWLKNGKSQEEFDQKVAPILNKDCVMCHNPQVNPTLPNLTTYEGVMKVADAHGASLPTLVRVSHIHLFGIAFILYFIGKIFILCELNANLKRFVVMMPFFGMLVDILSWIPARTIPQFAYVVVGAGAFMGLSMGFQILISLYQMWRYPFHPSVAISVADQIRINQCSEILFSFGYEMIPEEKGWLVKESLRSWQFLNSIAEMEAYVNEIKARHQSD